MSRSQILVIDDEADIRSMVSEILSDEGYRVSECSDGAQARRALEEHDPDLILLDIWMPDIDGITLLREWVEGGVLDCPVVIMSGHGTVDTAVEATRLGAHEFLEKPLSMSKLLSIVSDALAAGLAAKERDKAHSIVSPLVAPIGRSAEMRDLRERLNRVAPQSSPVLFYGEPGSGRETLARYLHGQSPRSGGRFVNVVLGGIHDQEAEAAFYGRETDTGVEPGYLEQARGGTLFLNELGDMSPRAQQALLAALESEGYTRVGGHRRQELDIRLVSSARPEMGEAVREGRFRQDLFNHLDLLPVHVPPLRAYRQDVPDLIRYYVDLLVDQEGLPFRRFSVAAQNRLRNYPWPGNLRELKNLVHRFLALGEKEEVSLEEVEEALAGAGGEVDSEPLVQQDLLGMTLREAREVFEKAYLEKQLELSGGRVGKLAERVGLERTHLYRKLKALGIDIHQGREE